MGQLEDWGPGLNPMVDLCTIRRPLFWHPDLIPSTLRKDHFDNDLEHSSCDDPQRPDDDSETSIAERLTDHESL